LCSLISADACDFLSALDLHDEEDNWGGSQEFNVRVVLQVTQNDISDRFQEFTDEFDISDDSTWVANLYDLESITDEIPIRVIFAD